MKIVELMSTCSNQEVKVESGKVYNYPQLIEYLGIDEEGKQATVKIGFRRHNLYGKDRKLGRVWIDKYEEADFTSADDFGTSGEMLSVIWERDESRKHQLVCPTDVVPKKYKLFNVVGFPTRVTGPKVPCAWAVVVNISDHKSMIVLANLKRTERKSRR